jgi:hypothetical protein
MLEDRVYLFHCSPLFHRIVPTCMESSDWLPIAEICEFTLDFGEQHFDICTVYLFAYVAVWLPGSVSVVKHITMHHW